MDWCEQKKRKVFQPTVGVKIKLVQKTRPYLLHGVYTLKVQQLLLTMIMFLAVQHLFGPDYDTLHNIKMDSLSLQFYLPTRNHFGGIPNLLSMLLSPWKCNLPTLKSPFEFAV